ncbi:MAG TPA: MaoC family dehydratase [Methylophilus sp.]|nr:MaoC family dehydratase [Methylophilus sp.]HQQ33437.1 MaoC family dehydratase [Methylophilus sp.]
MQKIYAGRYFEDFSLGEVIRHATPRTITTGDCALYMGLYGARQPLFCSAPFARDMGYPAMPVDDLLVFHIAFGKTVPDISVNAVANLGYADVRFHLPAYVGDTLSTTSEVIGLKQNSNGKSGVVWVRSTSFNQLGKAVLSWVRWVMVHKNNMTAAAPETLVPTLPEFVDAGNLATVPSEANNSLVSQTTGSQYFWEDYIVGEQINHPSGITINDSDHSMATHLYQNNARLHFDAHMMQTRQFGKRLVYGGVVISICRALSYEGLENALSIAAINAGTHANPSFAGDTIYTRSEVLDKWALSAQTGALRLRMTGIKNLASTDLPFVRENGTYHPNVVLDLDYTVMMPRKIT